MKNLNIKTLLVAVIATILFTGCSKSEDSITPSPVATFAGVKFKANGTSYEWPLAQFGFQMRLRSRQDNPSGAFTIVGQFTSQSAYLEMFLPIGFTLNTGTYNNTSINIRLNNSLTDYSSLSNCTTVITKVNNGLCSGTFSGTAYGTVNNQPLIITEGTFTDIPVIN